MSDWPALTPVGDSGVLVEFGAAVSDDAHDAVVALDRVLTADPPSGVIESVPAYVSVLVSFDPVVTDHEEVTTAIERVLTAGDVSKRDEPVTHVVPICYDGDFGPDLAEVAQRTDRSVDAVVEAHLAGSYRVAMYGFAPGAPYLSGVPESIRVPRRETAVPGIAAGTVIIAGPQCLLLPNATRTGWWSIGRSPTLLTRPDDDPFPFDPGDRVEFRRVDLAEYHEMVVGS